MQVAGVTADGYDTLATNLHSNFNDGTNTNIFRDGVLVGAGTTDATYTSPSTNALRIGAGRFDSRTIASSLQEVIIYNSDQSSNRFKIESNINNYYGIYTSLHNGFVETWYDQSGNGRHAEQATNDDQPQIVSNGSLLADGIDLRDSELVLSSSLSTQDYSVFTVNSGASGSYPYVLKGNLNSPSVRISSSNVRVESYAPVVVKTFTVSTAGSNQRLDSVFKDSSDDARVFRNATESTSGTQNIGSGSSPFTRLGRLADSGSIPVAEIIFFESDQSANRSGIESNIADEYGITLP
jgi:hypothetical protein